MVERHRLVELGTAPFPGEAISDVRNPVRVDSSIRFWLAARHHQALAEAICGIGSGTIAVHGEAATAFAWAGNTALRETCGPRARLGGAEADHHVMGIPLAHAQQLRITGTAVGGFVLVESAVALYPERGAQVRVVAQYPVDRYRAMAADGKPQSLRVEVECKGRRWLVVNNLMAALHPMRFVVESDGAGQAAALTTIAASYFPCSANGGMQVSITVLDATAVEILVL